MTGTFSDFMIGTSNQWFKNAFPNLNKFMDTASYFDNKDDKEDENKGEKDASDGPDEDDNTSRGRSRHNRKNTFEAEIANTLDLIYEEIKLQKHVHIVGNELQTETNKLLKQILGSGNKAPEAGNSSQNGTVDNIANLAIAGASLAEAIPMLSGILSILPEILAGAAVIGGSALIYKTVTDVSSHDMKKEYKKQFIDTKLEEKNKELKELQKDINDPSIPFDKKPLFKEAQLHLEIKQLEEERLKLLGKQNDELTKQNEIQKETTESNKKTDSKNETSETSEIKKEAEKETKTDEVAKITTTSASLPQILKSIPSGLGGIPIPSGMSASDMAGNGTLTNNPNRSSGGANHATGNLAVNQSEAYKAFKDLGYSDQAARVAVANLSGESLRNPTDVHADPSKSNPNQKAHGIASWDDARSERIRQEYGKMPNEMSVTDQVKAYDWEQKNYYKDVYAKMHDPNATPEEQMRSQVGGFEKPADVEGNIVSRMRNYRGLPANFNTLENRDLPENDPSVQNVLYNSKGMTAQEITNRVQAVRPDLGSQQCVALVQKFHPEVGGVKSWTRGADADKLPSGSALALFMDKNGNQTQHYDGGGIGTAKNKTLNQQGTSHAIIKGPDLPGGGFWGYEQWNGPNGKAHWAKFTPGNEDNEHNSLLYHGINHGKQAVGVPKTSQSKEQITPSASRDVKITDKVVAKRDDLNKVSQKEDTRHKPNIHPPIQTAQNHQSINQHVTRQNDNKEEKIGKSKNIGSATPPDSRLIALFTNSVNSNYNS